MGVKYDAGVIEQFAGDLYAEADGLIAAAVLKGLLAGLISGPLVAIMIIAAVKYLGGEATPGHGLIAAAVIVSVSVVSAYSKAQEKARELRLRAQTLLCSMQTEINTRPPAP